MAEQQPQGTEYTLQGVMRFLQTEWHSHERARNAWDIERAELKAKTAHQEGEVRNAKKKVESLDKHVRMLERALKYERAKAKTAAAKLNSTSQDPSAESKDANGKQNEPSDMPNGTLDIDADARAPLLIIEEQETNQDKAKHFLQKSVEELTYILTPPGNPPPPEGEPPPLQNSFVGQQDARLDDPYMRQQQQQPPPQPRRSNLQSVVSQFPPNTNHHPPPVRQAPEFTNASSIAQPSPEAPLMARQVAQQPHPSIQAFPSTADDFSSHMQQPQIQNIEDSVETVSHSYDSYGRPIPTGAEDVDPSRPLINEDTDGWNFDDPSLPLDPQPDSAPRRPDTDLFPAPTSIPPKSPTRTTQNRRRSSGSGSLSRRRSDGAHEIRDLSSPGRGEPANFKVRFALRGHMDVVRSVIFTGGGSPSEPEICTTGDDSTVKRWIIPSNYNNFGSTSQQQSHSNPPDLDIQSYFTHRGHDGIVMCLAACPASATFSTGGRITGDGWVFSGGQDATIRVWERGRVDPKATLEGHTDAVWALCVLPVANTSMFGPDSNISSVNGERILLASGSSDQTIRIWAVSAPPQISSPQNPSGGSRRGVGGSRRHSITSGSNFPSSPQPSIASNTPFHHTLLHSIELPGSTPACPTCISPLGTMGESFVVSCTDSSVMIFDTRTGEEVVAMASGETYDGTSATGINSVVVTSASASHSSHSHSLLEGSGSNIGHDSEEEGVVHGATGSSKDGGVEGVVITGHEDRYVRFFDANSGQCTYSMLAHPSAIACLSLSPDGRELVSAGHDASLRFWSLEKRTCIQEITSHRLMRGEGVVCVVWSADGRWVVSGGGDGVVKVFAR